MTITATLRTTRSWLAAGALLLVVAGALVYARSLDAPFLFDDKPAILRNESIRQLWPLSGPLSPPLDAAGATGRPLVNLTLALDYAWHGLEPRGYHVTNLVLHALATLALWGGLRRTARAAALRGAPVGGKNTEAWAWLVALVWTVHPLLSESVVCVVQRNEMLVALFYFLTFYAFARSVETGAARCAWQAAAVASMVLGVFSKEVMATAPVLLFLYDRTFVAGTFREAWRQRRWFYGALVLVWFPLAWLMAGSNQRDGIVGFGLGVTAWEYLVTQSHALWLYLKLTVWPHPLVVDYGFELYRLSEVWPQAVLIVTLLGATGWALVRRPVAGFLGAWFFVILAPSSSIVPLTTQTIAEHRMYLPLVALIGAALAGLPWRRPRVAVALGLAVAVAVGLVTARRGEAYRDEGSFWRGELANRPQNPRLQASYGYYLAQRGDWAKAILAYEQAVALKPDFADARSDLGGLLVEAGQFSEAVAQHAEAVRLKPTDAVIRFNQGMALARAGLREAAMAAWSEATRLRPALAPAWRELGKAAAGAGLQAEAGRFFAEAVRLAPQDVESLAGLGDARAAGGQPGEAVALYERAVAERPDVAELRYNLGNLRLQTDTLAEAERQFREAVRLKPEFAMARHNLALTLVRSDRAAEAIPEYRAVLQQLPGVAAVYHNLALALTKVGRVDDAIAADEAALRIDPRFGAARAHLESLRSGRR